MQLIALDRFHLKVSGLEKLPKSGPYIISSNHQSYLDPLILASVLPPDVFRRLFAVGTSDIFGEGFMRRLARSHQGRGPRSGRQSCARHASGRVRAAGTAWRSSFIPRASAPSTARRRIFKKGAAILSIHMQVPIVPVAIEGFYDAWPRNKSFQSFAPLKMVFGNPIYPPPESEASESAYEKLTADLKARIVEMWEELRRNGQSHSS